MKETLEGAVVVPGAAVAGATNQDVLILARTIYGEARGEERVGREAVANVVLNRVRDGRWPDSIAEVCLQTSQFSCWNHNDPNRCKIRSLLLNEGDALFDDCYRIAQKAILGNIADRVGNATHYHAAGISRPSWVGEARPTQIGRHLFYSDIA